MGWHQFGPRLNYKYELYICNMCSIEDNILSPSVHDPSKELYIYFSYGVRIIGSAIGGIPFEHPLVQNILVDGKLTKWHPIKSVEKRGKDRNEYIGQFWQLCDHDELTNFHDYYHNRSLWIDPWEHQVKALFKRFQKRGKKA